MTTQQPPLTTEECESRFWLKYGPRLFGSARKPATCQEWIDAATNLRGVLRLDDLAERLEQATQSRARVASERRRQLS